MEGKFRHKIFDTTHMWAMAQDITENTFLFARIANGVSCE